MCPFYTFLKGPVGFNFILENATIEWKRRESNKIYCLDLILKLLV